jgi:hypothetical protein
MTSATVTRTAVRDVAWIPQYAGPVAYLVALATWIPATALPIVLGLQGRHGAAIPALGLLWAAHFVPTNMLMSAAWDQGRSHIGLWAISAQIWLLAGGAARQAVRELRKERSA